MATIDLKPNEVMDILFILRETRDGLSFNELEEYSHYCYIENKICQQLMNYPNEVKDNGIQKSSREQRGQESSIA